MKERDVAFAPEARQDLLHIYDTIADAASPSVALAYVERLQGFRLRLGLASERGRRRDDVRSGLRVAGFERRVTVAFAVGVDDVTILRVFYGGRDWESAMRR